jgi:hypothetical protein
MTRLRAEHGFTLPELSVTMFAGVVVIGALFMIMIVTLRQTQRTFTKVDASRRARTVLANIENELHSACVNGGSDGSPPIQGVTNSVVQSDANNLVFLTFYGTSAMPKPTWHQITFSSANGGTLTETVYPVTGTSPNWSQGSPASSTTTLLTNVSQQTVGSNKVPVFQYYAYAQYTDSASGKQYMLIPDGTNLTTAGTTPNTPLSTSGGSLGDERRQHGRGCHQPERRGESRHRPRNRQPHARRAGHRRGLDAPHDATELPRGRDHHRRVRTMSMRRRLTNLLRREDGFTMTVALGVLTVVALLTGAVMLTVQGDARLTRADLDPNAPTRRRRRVRRRICTASTRTPPAGGRRAPTTSPVRAPSRTPCQGPRPASATTTRRSGSTGSTPARARPIRSPLLSTRPVARCG